MELQDINNKKLTTWDIYLIEMWVNLYIDFNKQNKSAKND